MCKPMLSLMLAVTLTLTACASGKPRTPGPTLTVPEADKAPCETIPQPKDGSQTELLANHVMTAKLYHQCRDRHQGLINWLESTDAVR